MGGPVAAQPWVISGADTGPPTAGATYRSYSHSMVPGGFEVMS